jgi:hypothetical protein
VPVWALGPVAQEEIETMARRESARFFIMSWRQGLVGITAYLFTENQFFWGNNAKE